MIIPVDIVSRKEWGARPPRQTQSVQWRDRTGVALHHTTGSNLGREDSAEWLRAIQAYHMDERGWWDIGYNLAVDRFGTAFMLRGWTKLGAHIAGHNTGNIGIVLLGDGRRSSNLTPAAMRTIEGLTGEASGKAGRALTIRGHGELAATACPGDDLQRWIDQGLPLDPDDEQEEDDGMMRLAPKPLIKPTRNRPARGSNHEQETIRVQSELTWVHGLGGEVGAIDGWPGPRTAAAVRTFQRRRGLGVDGIVGPETWPRLLA